MAKLSIVFGGLLIANGIYGYTCGDPEKESLTALIPAVAGVLIVVCGFLAAAKETMRKHFMHFGAGVGLLSALAAGGRLFSTLGKDGTDPFAQQNLVAGREEGGVLGRELAARRALQDDGEAPDLAQGPERGNSREALDVERREGTGGGLLAACGDHGSLTETDGCGFLWISRSIALD